jgi:hypothetical protein
MAATVIIQEWNGNSTKTDKTSSTVRFKSADNATVDTNNPLSIPASGQTYSYEKWLRLAITGTPPSQRINNLKFYTDGSNGYDSGSGFVKLWGEVEGAGAFRSAEAAVAANSIPLGGSGSVTMTNAFTYTANGALSLSTGAETFSGSGVDIGQFVVLVMEIEPSATQGTLTAETGTFSYDEI